MGIAIFPHRFSCELILESGEFGINFLPLEKAELVASVGGCSGRDVDKFQRFHIGKEQALKTTVPILEEAYAAYECKLVDHRTYGDHTWLVGEVVATHFEEGLLTDKGVLNLERVSPALYITADLYVTTARDSLRFLDRTVYGRG
jgi:flavin reductase (DIM6/NTAB) family NADH-FMN oxidoreductase RutF